MSSSPPLRALSLESSLQSHGNDNLPASPPRQGSDRPSLSPADCRTLEKILRDVASPPATPSPVEQNDQLFLNGHHGITNAADEEEDYHSVGGEATDTGYEDDDDSMELSEGIEDVIVKKAIISLGEPVSPSASKSDRRLQESISTHDEKEKMRYSSGRRSSTKRAKVKRPEHERTTRLDALDALGGDTIEDVTTIPDNHAPPPPLRSLDIGHSDSGRQAVPDDVQQLNRMRLSMGKVLEQELVEQEQTEGKDESSVFNTSSLASEDKAENPYESELDGFDADNERTQQRFSLGISGAPRRKISRIHAIKPEEQVSPAIPQTRTAETAVLVPSTPTPSVEKPEPAHMQIATNQTVPETPFTKTLSYFKQHKGAENSPSKKRRNTALLKEIIEVAGDVTNVEVRVDIPEWVEAQPVMEDTSLSTVTSALADLEAMVGSSDVVKAAGAPAQQEEDYVQVTAVVELTSDKDDIVTKPAISEDQKQIILYPQHPAFINVISMVPATMFWATAAPVVKYTGIAVGLLIDKLRDTYL
ncbi:uncharacterized protein M421DRAFT_89513 [Didymella exigua CBS 183.55]|uniref:Uncharacterized protein n=1 Tax=Didymella exigua CBS 183.55 TaxID=1150837 RepID=A0A6A5RXT7_9PLEO|nr:uncharacterized protein M421DRAFT_89513 [Didymella exigua CBS 183.55]KAF1932160.1 hypothetical protein M421DRAFT_89513 [Didymella exigua CBS 183.55]